MVLSGVSAFFIYLVSSQQSNLILSCIFGAVSTMGFNAMDCLGAELFPTDLRLVNIFTIKVTCSSQASRLNLPKTSKLKYWRVGYEPVTFRSTVDGDQSG